MDKVHNRRAHKCYGALLHTCTQQWKFVLKFLYLCSCWRLWKVPDRKFFVKSSAVFYTIRVNFLRAHTTPWTKLTKNLTTILNDKLDKISWHLSLPLSQFLPEDWCQEIIKMKIFLSNSSDWWRFPFIKKKAMTHVRNIFG